MRGPRRRHGGRRDETLLASVRRLAVVLGRGGPAVLPRFPHGDVGAVLDYGGLILDERLGGLTQVSPEI